MASNGPDMDYWVARSREVILRNADCSRPFHGMRGPSPAPSSPYNSPATTYTSAAKSCASLAPSCSSLTRTPRLLRRMRREAQKAPVGDDVYILRCKRTVRATSELSSSKVGELRVGTLLLVVERVELPDSTTRVRVVKHDCTQPIGWITNQGRKEQADALSAFHWMRFHSTSSRCSEQMQSASIRPSSQATVRDVNAASQWISRRSPQRRLPSAPTSSSPPGGVSDSRQQVIGIRVANVPMESIRTAVGTAATTIATRGVHIADAFACNAGPPVVATAASVTPAPLGSSTDQQPPLRQSADEDSQLTSSASSSNVLQACDVPGTELLPKQSAPGSSSLPPKTSTSQAQSGSLKKSMAPPSAAPNGKLSESSAAQRRSTVQSSSILPETCTASDAKSSQEHRPALPRSDSERFPAFMSSAMLSGYAEEQLRQAAVTDAQGLAKKQDLAAQIGRVLSERLTNAQDKQSFIGGLMRDWDPNRDGVISKMEFRQNVRLLLKDNQADIKEMDGLFDRLDLDKSGEIEILELKSALKLLMDSAAKANVISDAIRAKVTVMLDKAERTRLVAQLTSEAEKIAIELKDFAKKSVGAQLGSILTKKGVTVSDLVSKWGGKDGLITESEFRAQVTQLGLMATPTEVNALFAELDDDGGGTLDQEETKRALRKLSDEAVSVKAQIRRLQVKCDDLSKTAKTAQARWKQERAAELKEAEEERKLEEADSELRMAEARRAKEVKMALVAQKKAEEEAADAAFLAKVEMRRQLRQPTRA